MEGFTPKAPTTLGHAAKMWEILKYFPNSGWSHLYVRYLLSIKPAFQSLWEDRSGTAFVSYRKRIHWYYGVLWFCSLKAHLAAGALRQECSMEDETQAWSDPSKALCSLSPRSIQCPLLCGLSCFLFLSNKWLFKAPSFFPTHSLCR